MDFIFHDKMELALVAAVIDLSEKCERKERKKSKLETQKTSVTSIDQKITLEKLRNSSLLNRETTKRNFGPSRRNGVCETDEEERVLVTKALKHYNRLKHLDITLIFM